MKYTGKGFIYGVPARDLTQEEADHFGIDRLLKSGCYVLIEQPRRKSKRLEAAESVMEG